MGPKKWAMWAEKCGIQTRHASSPLHRWSRITHGHERAFRMAMKRPWVSTFVLGVRLKGAAKYACYGDT